MIVCHCAGVTDSHISRLIEEGCSTVAEISQRCGAGRCCAPCRREIASMVSSARPLGLDGSSASGMHGEAL